MQIPNIRATVFPKAPESKTIQKARKKLEKRCEEIGSEISRGVENIDSLKGRVNILPPEISKRLFQRIHF